ncbi:PH domain-containing protein [Lysinibacillus sp. KU-BSD001]|uniref:PH domain-containing protein n=1 Tax=Lysinibacillus sp. KU-BSD001 TaxID=3141328 RepID=UPI0036E4665B
MVYHVKVDMFSIIVIFLMIWGMGAITLLPLITSLSIVIIMFAMLIISAIFVWWYVISVKYVLHEDYLLVKGGPFKIKIPYHSITKVAPTTDQWTGYRISASDKGIELFYKAEAHRSINVLPKDKMEFIAELSKRCPHVQFPDNQEFE